MLYILLSRDPFKVTFCNACPKAFLAEPDKASLTITDRS